MTVNRRLRAVIAIMGALAVTAGGATASAQALGAAHPAPTRAGYLVTTKKLDSAHTRMRVPAVSCPKDGSTRVLQVGLFATTHRKSATKHLLVGVTVSCRKGKAVYTSSLGQTSHFGRGSSPDVHSGDELKLSMSSGGTEFEIENYTTGNGVGRAVEYGCTKGTDCGPMLARHLFVGGRFGKIAAGHVRTLFTKATVNGASLGSFNNRRVSKSKYRVGPLTDHGQAFAVSVR